MLENASVPKAWAVQPPSLKNKKNILTNKREYNINKDVKEKNKEKTMKMIKKVRGLIMLVVSTFFLTNAYANEYKVFEGDGSDEPGFVPPPRERKLPPAPPRDSASAETFISGGAPVTPMSRTEAKKPPVPPVLITKLKISSE